MNKFLALLALLVLLWAPSVQGATQTGVNGDVSLSVVSLHRTAPARVGLRLSNDSDTPIYFTGYGLAGPWYETARRTWRGWRGDRIAWCGTGAGLQHLEAGSAIDSEVPLPEETKGQFRAGVRLFHNVDAFHDGEGTWVWCPAINLSGGTTAAQLPVAAERAQRARSMHLKAVARAR